MNRNIIIAFFLSVAVSSYGQSAKEIKVKELLHTMGTTKAMKTSYEYMINYYKNPDIPRKYWDKAEKLISYEDLIRRIVPIYANNFSEREIDDLIVFYQTSTGKAMVEKMPVILQESLATGQIWGKELAEKIEKDLSKEKNYTSPPPPGQSK